MAVVEVTDATFGVLVLAATLPVVVDFWAPWCGPCQAVEPIVEQLEAESRGRVAFVRHDVESSPQASARFGVLSLPTLILFEAGEVRSRIVGARSRGHYERSWAPWLDPGASPK